MVVSAFLLSGYIDVVPSAPRAPAGFFCWNMELALP